MISLREAAQMALEALEQDNPAGRAATIRALRAALANDINQDWSLLEATQEALREHMAEIHRLRAALADHIADANKKEGDNLASPLPEPTCQESRQVEPVATINEMETVEPVAWRTFDGEGGYDYRTYDDNENYAAEWAQRNPRHVGWVEALYLAPPQRKPLTNQEIMREYAALWPFLQSEDHVLAQDILKFARAIERAHGVTE